MIKVFVAQHPTEAHLLKGLLESSGIPCEVRNEFVYGVRGEVPFPETFPEIWVNDNQSANALTLLRSREDEANTPKGQPWICLNCGETLDPQFTVCWQCNVERPNPA